MVAGNNQWPSEVLASLLEFCLPGEESTAFFRAAFTMRLADRLWQCHGPQTVAAVAVEEDQSDDSGEVVAALPARRGPQQK